MLNELLLGFGIIGIIIIIIIVLFVPIICTIVLGTYFATALGLTGLVWWAFVILFYLIIMGLLSVIA